jgi:hypothetical protein
LVSTDSFDTLQQRLHVASSKYYGIGEMGGQAADRSHETSGAFHTSETFATGSHR